MEMSVLHPAKSIFRIPVIDIIDITEEQIYFPTPADLIWNVFIKNQQVLNN